MVLTQQPSTWVSQSIHIEPATKPRWSLRDLIRKRVAFFGSTWSQRSLEKNWKPISCTLRVTNWREVNWEACKKPFICESWALKFFLSDRSTWCQDLKNLSAKRRHCAWCRGLPAKCRSWKETGWAPVLYQSSRKDKTAWADFPFAWLYRW
jgi:hypothetical protein